MSNEEDIAFLEKFRAKIAEYLFLGYAPTENNPWGNSSGLLEMKDRLQDKDFKEVRRQINMMKGQATQILGNLGIGTVITQYPPPAVGGPILKYPIFDLVLTNRIHEGLEVEVFTDKIDEAIGALQRSPLKQELAEPSASLPTYEVTLGFVFIAMAMSANDPQLDDVHDAIKSVAMELGLDAQRVDDPNSNERITDRILKSLQSAQFVVADLTHAKPNVYWEAGYAHALRKVPIYIARNGTKLEFDVKDYPVIFFANIRELRQLLTNRLTALMKNWKHR